MSNAQATMYVANMKDERLSLQRQVMSEIVTGDMRNRALARIRNITRVLNFKGAA